MYFIAEASNVEMNKILACMLMLDSFLLLRTNLNVSNAAITFKCVYGNIAVVKSADNHNYMSVT